MMMIVMMMMMMMMIPTIVMMVVTVGMMLDWKVPWRDVSSHIAIQRMR